MIRVKRVCVYCGSASGAAPAYRESAMRLGQLLAEAGIGLVYGGGSIGLMGRWPMRRWPAGGHVTGIIPGHLQEREIGHTGSVELVVVGSMHERKQKMFELADAFAVLPGGLGTSTRRSRSSPGGSSGCTTSRSSSIDVGRLLGAARCACSIT